jgi:hypothetical protein
MSRLLKYNDTKKILGKQKVAARHTSHVINNFDTGSGP